MLLDLSEGSSLRLCYPLMLMMEVIKPRFNVNLIRCCTLFKMPRDI